MRFTKPFADIWRRRKALSFRDGHQEMIKYLIRINWLNYANIKHTGEAFNSRTILAKGSGQITGTLGEMAFGRWLTDLGIDFEYCADESKNYDFLIGDYRIDVKTKKTHGVQKSNYMVRIPDSQKNQKCDLYVFAYCNDHDIYLLGFSEKLDFWESIGHSVIAGQKTETHIERVDATFAYIKDLSELERLEFILSKQ